MKKLLLALIIVAVMAMPTTAFAKEWRIQADLQFADQAKYIEVINYLESIKQDARSIETKAGWVSSIKAIESWDTELNDAPENTLFRVDFSTSAVTHVVKDDVTQKDVDDLKALSDAKQVKVDEEKAIIDIKQAEVIAKEDKELIAK